MKRSIGWSATHVNLIVVIFAVEFGDDVLMQYCVYCIQRMGNYQIAAFGKSDVEI